jgi:hypothetical protein
MFRIVINQILNTRTKEQINNQKWYFKRTNKIDKSSDRLIKKNRREIQRNKSE